MPDYGCRSMTDPLRRVLVRRPSVEACTLWEEYGWRAEPDPTALLREHERFCSVLEEAGAEIVLAEPLDDDPDAIYTFDPGLVTESGAVLMRPGKEGRRQEPSRAAQDLEAAGVPVAGDGAGAGRGRGRRLHPPRRSNPPRGSWLPDERGGHRRRLATAARRRACTSSTFPYWRGESEVMHLLSLLSPLDADLVVAYPPLLPVALAQLLDARGIEIVPVPDEEFASMGTNVLALAPRVALALDGSPVTRARLAAAGVEVLVYEGNELSLKGDGGPTCLTMPLLRD